MRSKRLEHLRGFLESACLLPTILPQCVRLPSRQRTSTGYWAKLQLQAASTNAGGNREKKPTAFIASRSIGASRADRRLNNGSHSSSCVGNQRFQKSLRFNATPLRVRRHRSKPGPCSNRLVEIRQFAVARAASSVNQPAKACDHCSANMTNQTLCAPVLPCEVADQRSGSGIARKFSTFPDVTTLAGEMFAQAKIDIADQVYACGLSSASNRQPLARYRP